MAYFYTREPGLEGQILAAEGQAGGQTLTELLAAGPMPVKAALELVACCADILTIAEEDGVVHGAIHPDRVRMDSRGAVSIEAWGAPHAASVAHAGRIGWARSIRTRRQVVRCLVWRGQGGAGVM